MASTGSAAGAGAGGGDDAACWSGPPDVTTPGASAGRVAVEDALLGRRRGGRRAWRACRRRPGLAAAASRLLASLPLAGFSVVLWALECSTGAAAGCGWEATTCGEAGTVATAATAVWWASGRRWAAWSTSTAPAVTIAAAASPATAFEATAPTPGRQRAARARSGGTGAGAGGRGAAARAGRRTEIGQDELLEQQQRADREDGGQRAIGLAQAACGRRSSGRTGAGGGGPARSCGEGPRPPRRARREPRRR